MRVLSKQEKELTSGEEGVPIDLRASFFPAMFRIYEPTPPEVAPEGKLSCKPVDRWRNLIERRLDRAFNLKSLTLKGSSSTEYSAERHLRDHGCEVVRFTLGDWEDRKTFHPYYGLISVNQLLTRGELERHGITPYPGYLYLGATILRSEIEPGAVSLYEADFCQARSFYSDWRDRYGGRHEGGKDMPLSVWRGPIGDVEFAANAAQIYSTDIGEQHRSSLTEVVQQSILVTPLELPVGFVMDTACVLNRLKHRIPRVAKLFIECVTTGYDENRSAKNRLPDYRFPHGDLPMNEERWWIHSSRPWFVQHILLSRIIGGAYWKYNLQRYEIAPKSLDADVIGAVPFGETPPR